MPKALKTKKAAAGQARELMEKRIGGGHVFERDGAATILKAAVTEKAGYKKAERLARFVMSTQEVDRYGDIVVTAGIQTDRFLQNPVALMGHSHRVPVGNWSDLEKVLKARPPRLEGDIKLLPEGGPVREVEETAWLIENDGIRACSIGFLPDWDNIDLILDDDEEYVTGLQFNECELLECSPCTIPANPGALMKSIEAGQANMAKELIEKTLDEWTKDPVTGLLIPRKDFEALYELAIVGAGGGGSAKTFTYTYTAKDGGTPSEEPKEEPKEPAENPDVPEEVVTTDDVVADDADKEEPKPETAPEGAVTSDDVPKDKQVGAMTVRLALSEDGITLLNKDGTVGAIFRAEDIDLIAAETGILGDPQPEKIKELLDGLDQTKKVDGFLSAIKSKFMEIFSRRSAGEEEPAADDVLPEVDPVAVEFAKAKALAVLATSKSYH